MLILGRVLAEFLQARRKKNKQPCKPWELYCVRCRAPKLPAGNMADYTPVTEKFGNLVAICPDGDCLINRRVSLARIAEIQGKVDIRFPEEFEHLIERANSQGKKLSKATLHATLTQLKRFFQWPALQPGYKSRVQYSDAEYFNLSDKDARIATAKRQQRFPTVAQIKHVISKMPKNTEIERRNRALIAFTLLTGARGPLPR
jgi:hypothetical protein